MSLAIFPKSETSKGRAVNLGLEAGLKKKKPPLHLGKQFNGGTEKASN